MIAILTDVTKCDGCYQCVQACAQANGLGPDIPVPRDAADGLSARRFTAVLEQPAGHYVRKHCRHCLDPACVSACPVGAMQKTPQGPVIYDSNRCMGCRYCMMACPYGIPRYQWDTLTPKICKCTLCYQGIKAGGLPACVEACPQQATMFGERNELLAEAYRRLEAEPHRYIQQVYGEHEVGGCSVLYVSDVSLDFLWFQNNPGQQPLPELTWMAIKKVPPVAVGMMALMAGTYWIIERRMKLMGAKATPPKTWGQGNGSDS
jgi:formate dehydrogenase iron-sulfur subunit